MSKFEFTVIATGVNPTEDDFEDRFVDAGCDDATIAFQKGLIVIEFDREGTSYAAALSSALRDVDDAGAVVKAVEPTHLVSLADIARRSNLTRAAISHYSSGARGSDFPQPALRVTTDSPLWDWSEVASWLYERDQIDRSELVRAQVVRVANTVLSHRNEGIKDDLETKLLAAEREIEHGREEIFAD